MTPTLNDAPASGPWHLAQPSAQVVQQHYVNARVHEINSTLAGRYREETVEALLADYSSEIKGSKSKKRRYAEEAYDFMTKMLQSRQLTINLNAISWFAVENRYESYTQMYERAIDKATGQMFLTDSDPLNPANVRATADDRVTFPQHWGDVNEATRRGLVPGAIQPHQSITSRMLTGAKIPAYAPPNYKYLNKVTRADGSLAFQSKNPKFNPKTKQVFTALNYGQRPHGSSTQYGMSYMVVNPNFKVDAIYFAGDTFFIPGADYQVTYQSLGSLYLKAKADLRRLLVRTTLRSARLEDTDKAEQLVEAHLFSPLHFSNGITELHLEENLDPDVVTNAWKFCRKWGIRLFK